MARQRHSILRFLFSTLAVFIFFAIFFRNGVLLQRRYYSYQQYRYDLATLKSEASLTTPEGGGGGGGGEVLGDGGWGSGFDASRHVKGQQMLYRDEWYKREKEGGEVIG